jgi:hypothetical protein
MLQIQQQEVEKPILAATVRIEERITTALKDLTSCNRTQLEDLAEALMGELSRLGAGEIMRLGGISPCKFRSVGHATDLNEISDPKKWWVEAVGERQESRRFQLAETPLNVKVLFRQFFHIHPNIYNQEFWLTNDIGKPPPIPSDSKKRALLVSTLFRVFNRARPNKAYTPEKLREKGVDEEVIVKFTGCLQRAFIMGPFKADELLTEKGPDAFPHILRNLTLVLASLVYAYGSLLLVYRKVEAPWLKLLQLASNLADLSVELCCRSSERVLDYPWAAYGAAVAGWYSVETVNYNCCGPYQLQGKLLQVDPEIETFTKARLKALGGFGEKSSSLGPLLQEIGRMLAGKAVLDQINACSALTVVESARQAHIFLSVAGVSTAVLD